MLLSNSIAKVRAAPRSRRRAKVAIETVVMYRPTNYLQATTPDTLEALALRPSPLWLPARVLVCRARECVLTTAKGDMHYVTPPRQSSGSPRDAGEKASQVCRLGAGRRRPVPGAVAHRHSDRAHGHLQTHPVIDSSPSRGPPVRQRRRPSGRPSAFSGGGAFRSQPFL